MAGEFCAVELKLRHWRHTDLSGHTTLADATMLRHAAFCFAHSHGCHMHRHCLPIHIPEARPIQGETYLGRRILASNHNRSLISCSICYRKCYFTVGIHELLSLPIDSTTASSTRTATVSSKSTPSSTTNASVHYSIPSINLGCDCSNAAFCNILCILCPATVAYHRPTSTFIVWK
jgi:hypothetical protein